MEIRIELDTVRKYRNTSEWRNLQRARFGIFEAVGDDRVIVRLCRLLAQAGWPLDAEVHIYRSQTRCFEPAPLSVWAEGRAGQGEQPAHLRKD